MLSNAWRRNGAVTYEVVGALVVTTWRCEWDNSVAEKNSATAKLERCGDMSCSLGTAS